jgi:putative molybdopterin biosynthesis protein
MDPGNPAWGWASLVNRAETFLLEGIAAGHSPTQVESALSVAAARWTDLQEEATATEPSRSDEHLRFAGSHDLALEILAREAAGKVAVATDYVGSLGGLIALAREEADLAGIHLWDETTGEYNAPFVCRLLPGRRVMLATLVSRSVGLMVRPGNPDGIRSLADLGRVRFVNRQTGSGTRVWLDAQLRSAGVEPQNLDGYDREERTHLAVAGAVERSEADAGLGIAAAAAAAGLDFVPLTWERYDLVFPEAVWSSPAARSLVAVMRSERFAAAVAELGGYRVPGGPAEPLIVG